MQVHIHIDDQSTANDLEALSVFAFKLALGRSLQDIPDAPLSAPFDQAELTKPEPEPELPESEPATTDTPTRRRRRTKAEMEAEAAAIGFAEPAAKIPVEQGDVAEATPLVESPEATPPAPVMDTPVADAAPVSPSNGATYTAADVQKMAVDAARRYGPEKVKALIAEYPNASKIADLKAEDLAGFVAKLNALSVE